MKIAKALLSFLESFLSAEWLSYAVRAFEANSNLRLATKDEDTAVTSPHTSTAHNADETQYIPVRDKRNEAIPLVLRPVTSAKNPVGFVVVLDSDKVSDMEHCEQFATLYMGKTLASKKTFTALNASLFARQSGEDIRNNFAQKETRKAKDRQKLVEAAKPFISLPDIAWQAVRSSVVTMSEDLAEIIDEMRDASQNA